MGSCLNRYRGNRSLSGLFKEDNRSNRLKAEMAGINLNSRDGLDISSKYQDQASGK